MLQADRGTTAREKILNAICLTGQFPFDMYSLIADEDTSARAIYRMLLEMRTDRLLNIGLRGGETIKTVNGKKIRERAEKAIRFNFGKKNEEGTPEIQTSIVNTMGNEVLEHYMATTYQHKFHGGANATQRDLRQAEIMLLLQRSGARVYRSEKPPIAHETYQKIEGAIYYTSREILEGLESKAKLASRSRYFGIYMCPGGAYATFNYTGTNARGVQRSEESALRVMTEVVTKNWAPPQSKTKTDAMLKLSQALLFGHNADVVLQLATHKKEKGTRTEGRGTDRKAITYANIESVYEDLFFIPVNEDAHFQLWLLSQQNWRERMTKGLISETYLDKTKSSRIYDAYIPQSKQAVLCWVDANINDIKLLKSELNRTTDTKYVVMCLPWQEAIVKQVLEERVQTDIVTQAEIKKIFEGGM